MFLIHDFKKMTQDISQANSKVGIWGKALNIPQVLGGLLFIYTLEGALVLAILMSTLIVASQIHKRSPFSRLIGICHLPWFGLLPWLIWRLQTQAYNLPMKLWLYYVTATILISLLFDINDIFQYARGSKTFTWAEAPENA